MFGLIVGMKLLMNKRQFSLMGLFLIAFAICATLASPAYAVSGGIGINIPGIGSIGISATFCSGAPFGITGLGDVLCNIGKSLEELPGLFTALAYLFGCYLAVTGILKLKAHIEDPRQTPVWDSMKRFLAGGAFFALPIVIEAAKVTITGQDQDALKSYKTGMFAGSTGGDISLGPISIDLPFVNLGGIDKMMVGLIADIWAPMLALIGSFGYLAGIILIMIGISRLLKTAQDGPRGPGGMGTIMTFITAGCLFSLDSLMGAFQSSVFASHKVANFAVLGTQSGSPNVDSHTLAVISAILGFMIIVGWISFVRGIFIFRDVAEGNNQASLMAAITHMIGGAMAVNLGALLNAVQSTFGLLPYGVIFAPV